MSTIFALSTVLGKSAVALVRISGPQSRLVLTKLCGSSLTRIAPRQATLKTLRHPNTSETLDKALTLFFSGPATFTGEDICELHLHGSRAVIKSVLEAIPSCHPSIRYAEPGEFSKRAFYNGKMDLTQAEGLADLIDSETDEQRRSAYRQAEGSLSRLYDGWREQLVKMRSQLEAIIDFGEDNDGIEDNIYESVLQDTKDLQSVMRNHLKSSLKGELLRSGVKVAIFGPPNAGKSSLLNILAQRDASIVSPEAGTTRDIVDTILDIGGFPVIISDTAGLREGNSVGAIEREGVKRAKQRVEDADLRICMIPNGTDIDESTRMALQSNLVDLKSVILLLNKTDSTDNNLKTNVHKLAADLGISQQQIIETSCITQQGIDVFLHFMQESLRELTTDDTKDLGSNARHREQVNRCLSHLSALIGQ